MKMKSIKIMLAGLLAVPVLALGVGAIAPSNVFAAGLKEGATAAQGDSTPTDLGAQFKIIANTALFIIGAVSVLMLIYGGIRYTVSGGDEKAVTAAKNTILYAVVGIIVAVMAYAIVNFVITAFAGGSATPAGETPAKPAVK